MRKKWKQIVMAAIILAMALLVGCEEKGGMDDNSNKQTSKEEMTTTKKENAKPKYVSDSEIEAVLANPDKYKGKYIKITGQVFNVKSEDDMYMLQLNYNVKKSDVNESFIVETKEKFSDDDYLLVDGEIRGKVGYENMAGAKMGCLAIKAKSVEKKSYADAVAPTKKEVKPEGVTVTQNKVSISIDNVEFADEQTRMYLTQKNNSASKCMMYSFNMKITQDGKQFEPDSSESYKMKEAGLSEPKSEILAGVSDAGVVVFPKLDASKPFQMIIEGHTDDYDLEFTPFTFDIKANGA